MGRLFDGPGIWIILVVVVLLFGATRLPALARSIGQSTKIFREEIKSDKPADPAASGDATPAAEPVAPAASTTAAPTTTDTGTSGTTSKP
jgi:sec-independent protein translocase protein TatA